MPNILITLIILLIGSKVSTQPNFSLKDLEEEYLQLKNIDIYDTSKTNIYKRASIYNSLNQYDSAMVLFELLERRTCNNANDVNLRKEVLLKLIQVSQSARYMEKHGRYIEKYVDFINKCDTISKLDSLKLIFHLAVHKYLNRDLENAEKEIDSYINLIEESSDNHYNWAAYSLKAYCILETRKDENLALENFYRAHEYALLDFTARNTLLNSCLNIGNYFRLLDRYEKAIEWFDLAEEAPLGMYKMKTLRVLYENKADVLKKMKYFKESLEYTEAVRLIDKNIKDHEQNKTVHEINTKYQVAEKDEKIEILQKWRNNYEKNKWWALASMILIFGLSAYSYMRWRKSDHERGVIAEAKTKLEVEHRQTQEEISKIKQLVIKDHIVLKNKAKVLLEELLYIKAEDHYLLLQTKGEKEFVRGKLSAIKEELPPNFIRCHRSYIVNQNFIAQYRNTDVLLSNDQSVPVSRSYKKNWPGGYV